MKEDPPSSPIVGDTKVGQSDLIPGVYEGGFKLWECTADLMSELLRYCSCGGDEMRARKPLKGLEVLELGVGHGLLSIASAMAGAKRVTMQDFNAEVVDMALRNAHANLKGDELAGVRGVSGTWPGVVGERTADLILSAETAYDENAVPHLLDAMSRALKPEGVALTAQKRFYFGLGGGSVLLKEEALKHGLHLTHEREVSDGLGNVRDVLRFQPAP